MVQNNCMEEIGIQHQVPKFNINCDNEIIVNVMKRFTFTDLNNNILTDDVFAFFDDNIVFDYNGYQVGKTVGWYLFKILCEYNMISIESVPRVSIIDNDDYVIWGFTCRQKRWNSFILPKIFNKEVFYDVTFEANIYFNDEMKMTKFDIIETRKNKVPDEYTIF